MVAPFGGGPVRSPGRYTQWYTGLTAGGRGSGGLSGEREVDEGVQGHGVELRAVGGVEGLVQVDEGVGGGEVEDGALEVPVVLLGVDDLLRGLVPAAGVHGVLPSRCPGFAPPEHSRWYTRLPWVTTLGGPPSPAPARTATPAAATPRTPTPAPRPPRPAPLPAPRYGPATGLIKGYTAATPFVDEKTCFPNPVGQAYCPHDYDYKYHGVAQMRYALANSLNIPAVKMLKLNGIDAMIATASAMGITTFNDPSRYGLSLTLGGAEVTMLDMTQAFGVFANYGYRVDLHPILQVTNKSGKVLEEYDPPQSPIFGKRVLPEGVSFIIADILSDNSARAMEFGTNSPLQIGKYKIPVKTGTTNDYRDNWTIGFTPSYVVAVWVGNNDDTPMQGVVSGITGAAPIWHKIMQHLIENNPPPPLKKPNNVVGITVCATSGLLPSINGSDYSCPTRYEYFIKGTVPNKTDPGKLPFFIDTTNNKVVKEKTGDNIIQSNEAVVEDPLGDTYCVSCAPPATEQKTP